MYKNPFFKPTPLYKEFQILNIIEKHKKITQREISEIVGSSVSMINMYLDEYEKKGYLIKTYKSKKNVDYVISKKGIDRRNVLNISYLNVAQNLYNSAKQNINQFLVVLNKRNIKTLLFYGAGEVAEIILQSILYDQKLECNVLAIIDDDIEKIGTDLVGIDVVSLNDIVKYNYDAVFISSYTNSSEIFNRLVDFGISNDKIIEFF